jgi:putative PIN family toxin of toxin-antitoxin system
MKQRIVLDTNVYVSRLLSERSVPGRAVAKAWREAIPLVSRPTVEELRAVLRRPKFDAYVRPETIDSYLAQIWSLSVHIFNPRPIHACRDPRDDKFLEVAVHGRADAIVTGDADLLALHPFRGIEIVSPADFLAMK